MDIASCTALSLYQILWVAAQIAASFTTCLQEVRRLRGVNRGSEFRIPVGVVVARFLPESGAPSVDIFVGRVGLGFGCLDAFPFEGCEEPAPKVCSGVADCTADRPSTSEAIERTLAVNGHFGRGIANWASMAMAKSSPSLATCMGQKSQGTRP